MDSKPPETEVVSAHTLPPEPSRWTLSVVIPVFNERYLVEELLRRVLAVDLEGLADLEVVVVDDGSSDGSEAILDRIAAEEPRIRLLRHGTNRGKGAAVRTGLAAVRGDLVLIQDADLEYDPADYPRLLRPFVEDGADVVYGSRYLAADRRRVLPFRHSLGNRLLTGLSNLLTDLDLTDMETCYKVFRTPLLRSIPLRSDDFAMEPELTAKVAKRGFDLYEVPISYVGRSYQEGKKIGWRDGIRAVLAMVRFWLVDDCYGDDALGSQILHRLESTRRFNRWMAEALRPWVGDRVLEVGAGLGNVTRWLLPRDHWLATDRDPNHLHYLEGMAEGRPYLEVAPLDLEAWARGDAAAEAVASGRPFDTVLAVNVLEHLDEPVAALERLASRLEEGGRLVLYVPAHPALRGRIDDELEHRRRYTRDSLVAEIEAAGLEVEHLAWFNRVSVPAWWLNGKVLRRRRFGRVQLKLFDLSIPLLRRVDRLFPWPGLGLVAVARHRDCEPRSREQRRAGR